MKRLDQLVRPNILALAPYSTARDDYQGDAVDVWLDANESPYDNGYNRYPDPHQRALKAMVSQLKGIEPERIFIGNGSDEAIDLVYRVFCSPGVDNVVAIAPSYGMYSVAAAINDVEIREVLLDDDFSLPVDRLLDATDSHSKAIWICSPNNPTGNAFALDDIARLLESFGGIVVVDEAYADFSSKGTALSLLDTHPNLIVLQTMSKARGMAALRLGMAFASPAISSLFANVKYPYNISALTQATVMRVLAEPIDTQIAAILDERGRLARELTACPCVIKVYPSDANFLLVKVTDADAIYDALMRSGVIVRNRSRMPLCGGCLRITVGTPAENSRVIQILNSYNR